MANANSSPVNENPSNFNQLPNPFKSINLISLFQPLNPLKPQAKTINSRSISAPENLSSRRNPSKNRSSKKKAPENKSFPKDSEDEDEKPDPMLEQFYWECENLPDFRHHPKVEALLKKDPVFAKKENPSKEEIEENEKWWTEFRASPVVKFLTRATEISDKLNRLELHRNSEPYHIEDAGLWKEIPNVIGLDGRPMPRKAIMTPKEAHDKFWDFARQFFFGLWGFKQRPYPSGRPIDVAQAIGYKRLEERYYDFAMKTGGWFYKDRLGRSRGPMELIQLKTAWGAGIIDRHTFVWGEDMDEWAPIGMIYGLERAIATWEVRLGAAATAFHHKLKKGIPPWVPVKDPLEGKTYKQLQEEAYDDKHRDLAVLKLNDGEWPGVRTPSHALFLWASGSELTSVLEADHMPNKFITKDLRRQLQKVIPGLRPWEVLSVEQAMDMITYVGEWFREPLGSYRTGPPYIREHNDDLLRLIESYDLVSKVFLRNMSKRIPGFIRYVRKNFTRGYQDRLHKRELNATLEKRAKEYKELYGRYP